MPLDVDVLRYAGERLDQCAQKDVVDVGVAKALAGRRFERCCERATNTLGLVGPIQSPGITEVDVSGFARGVCEQHPDSHLRALRVLRRVELRQVLLHRVVKPHPALLVQLHDGSRRREHLRQRRDIEDRVLGHRFRGSR